MYDPHTRESRGFAFVTMVRPEDADAAMSVLNGFELHGRAMSVSMVCRPFFLPPLCLGSPCLWTVPNRMFPYCCVFRPDAVVPELLLPVNTVAHLSVSGAWVCLITLMVSGLMHVGETHCSRLVEHMILTRTHSGTAR